MYLKVNIRLKLTPSEKPSDCLNRFSRSPCLLTMLTVFFIPIFKDFVILLYYCNGFIRIFSISHCISKPWFIFFLSIYEQTQQFIFDIISWFFFWRFLSLYSIVMVKIIIFQLLAGDGKTQQVSNCCKHTSNK